jgi:hypothetical protein
VHHITVSLLTFLQVSGSDQQHCHCSEQQRLFFRIRYAWMTPRTHSPNSLVSHCNTPKRNTHDTSLITTPFLADNDNLYQIWQPVNTTNTVMQRSGSRGFYDEANDRIIFYGGTTCLYPNNISVPCLFNFPSFQGVRSYAAAPTSSCQRSPALLSEHPLPQHLSFGCRI